MKNLFKIMAVAFAVLVMAGTAWSFDATDHVKIAPNGKGDLLVYPFYVGIPGGWENKITVVNTSSTQSVVAKVVFRSWVESEEVLDFFLYLSPRDMWTGYIYHDGTNTVIDSDDDSYFVTFPQALFPVTCPDDSNQIGYVTVFEAAAFNANAAAFSGLVKTGEKTTRPVTKALIRRIYGTLTSANIATNYQPENVLAGWLEFGLPELNLNSMVQATTLRDWDNETKLTTAAETSLLTDANNNLCEIEAALNKNNIAKTYVNTEDSFSLHFFTFPTKYTFAQKPNTSAPEGDNYCECVAASMDEGAFWDGRCYLTYTPWIFDMEENTPEPGEGFSGGTPTTYKLPFEVNILSSIGFPYEEGWVEYQISTGNTTCTAEDGVTSLTFSGVPVIDPIVHFRNAAFAMESGAWDDGTVSTSAATLDYYQYAD